MHTPQVVADWFTHFSLHLIGSHTSACVFRLTSFVCMQETSSAKNKDASPPIVIICAKCQKTLPASAFAKTQQKKNQKGRPCMCLGCSAEKGSGKTPVKSGASSSDAPANKVVSLFFSHMDFWSSSLVSRALYPRHPHQRTDLDFTLNH